MKATVSWLGVLLLAGAAVPAANAQPGYPGYPCYPNVAPDACGAPSYWCQGRCGATYPNYCVRPPCEPFNGFVPPVCHGGRPAWPGGGAPPQGPPPSPVFPTHPYARSPRDYFMIDLQ